MPTSAPNFQFTDYAQELQNVERKRKLSEALFQQGLDQSQGPQAVGGIQSPMSPLQPLAQMLKMGMSGYMGKQADTEGKTLSAAHNKALVDALTKLGSNPTDPGTVAALTQMPETMQAGVSLSLQNAQRQALMGLGNSSSTPASAPAAPQQGTQPVSLDAMKQLPQSPQGTPQVQNQVPLGFGGPAGGVPMKMWLMGDPTSGYQKYIEQLAKDHQQANTAVVNRGFGVGTMQNGQYVPAPESTTQAGQTAGTVAGAQAQARAPYEFHNVTTGSGASIPVSAADLNAGKLPSYYQGGTPKTQNQPSADPWQNIPKLQTPSGVGQTTFQREFQAKQAENANTLGQKFGTQADMSSQRLAYNQQALELLNTSATGPLALQSAQLKNWLVSSNLVPESAFKHPPSDTIALNKDLLNAAAEKAKQRYGSRMTQSEVMLQIKQGAPNVDMTKAAIKYLLDSDNAMAQYHTQQANDYGKYIQQGGDPMRFEGWYARNFPMGKSVGQVQLHNSGTSVDDLIKKYAKP